MPWRPSKAASKSQSRQCGGCATDGSGSSAIGTTCAPRCLPPAAWRRCAGSCRCGWTESSCMTGASATGCATGCSGGRAGTASRTAGPSRSTRSGSRVRTSVRASTCRSGGRCTPRASRTSSGSSSLASETGRSGSSASRTGCTAHRGCQLPRATSSAGSSRGSRAGRSRGRSGTARSRTCGLPRGSTSSASSGSISSSGRWQCCSHTLSCWRADSSTETPTNAPNPGRPSGTLVSSSAASQS
mmetsp:Transcript_7730/g.18766  ORF Transcript_7730/g.18766 Transcript_7730/m.18766 type:complete len:243 (+) Transcript_7730:116-844(+)